MQRFGFDRENGFETPLRPSALVSLTTAQNGQIVPGYRNGRRGSHSGYGVGSAAVASVNLRFH